MMLSDNKKIIIDGFPEDNHVWRAEWFGKMMLNPNQPTNHSIPVVLSRISTSQHYSRNSDYALTLLQKDFRDRNTNQKICSIGLGELNVVSVGTVWWNGQRVDTGYQFETYEPDLPILDVKNNIRAFNTSWRHEDGSYMVPFDQYPIGNVGAGCPVLGINHDGVQDRIIIPMYELLRFYYGVDGRLVVKMFQRPWGDVLRDLIEPDSVKMFHEERRMELKVRQGLDQSVGRTISAFLDESGQVNSSSFAYKKAEHILRSVNQGQTGKGKTFPIVYPPIVQKPRFLLSGKWIRSGGEDRFLVFRILNGVALTNGYDIDTVDVVTVPKFDDSDREWEITETGTRPRRTSDFQTGRITHGHEHNKSNRNHRFWVEQQAVRNPVEIRREVRVVDVERPLTEREVELVEKLLATGDGNFSDSAIEGASFVEKVQKKKKPSEKEETTPRNRTVVPVEADFSSFYEIVEAWASFSSAPELAFISVSGGSGTDNRFPVGIEWSTPNNSVMETRAYRTLHVRANTFNAYITDIERRGSEQFGMYWLCSPDGHELSAKKLRSILERFALADGMRMREIVESEGLVHHSFKRSNEAIGVAKNFDKRLQMHAFAKNLKSGSNIRN